MFKHDRNLLNFLFAFSSLSFPLHNFDKTYMVFMVAIALVFAPSKLYGTVNHKKKGLHYVQLPASVLEKTVSMFVVSFVCVTLSMLVSLFAAETLFYLLLPSRFSGSLFTDSIRMFTVKTFFDLFVIQSLFVLGNMVFKRQKVAKTFAVFMGFTVLLSLAAGLVIKAMGTEVLERFTDMLFEKLSQGTMESKMAGITYGVSGLVAASCWFGTYRLIKTTKY